MKIGLPPESPGDGAFDACPEVIEFKPAGEYLPATDGTMPENGWLWRLQAGRYVVERPGSDPCPRPLSPPDGFVQNPGRIVMTECLQPGGPFPIQYDSYYLPEEQLDVVGPIEDYTDQTYDYSTPAPTPPPQTTVEQSIENDLEQPHSALLRQWVNYQLGSPNETDPLGIGPPNAGVEFPDFERHWRDHEGEFPEYTDPWEYWQGAVDIIERGDRSPGGGEGVQRCERTSNDSVDLIYWGTSSRTTPTPTFSRIATKPVHDKRDTDFG